MSDKEKKNAKAYLKNSEILVNLSKLCDNQKLNIGHTQFDMRVTKTKQKVLLKQNFRIVSVKDPHTSISYDLDKIVQLNLIDKHTSQLFLPSTSQFIQLDEGIRLGIVNARLINEYFETTDESFQYLGHSSRFFSKKSSPILKFNRVLNCL